MRLVLALPWYAGPDESTYQTYFDMMMYFGALRERSLWFDRMQRKGVGAAFFDHLEELLPLDESRGEYSSADPTQEEWKELAPLQIAIADYSRTSLVGFARESVVDKALSWDADWIFWWDADMLFSYDMFLRLWRHKKPVVSALPFTARPPVYPAIFSVDPKRKNPMEGSVPIIAYPKDKLMGNEDVAGEIAFGAAVMLTNADVFRQIPKPWFNSTGCGEDWFFCNRCVDFGIPRFVDTEAKTRHKIHSPSWADEELFAKHLEAYPDFYKKQHGEPAYEAAMRLMGGYAQNGHNEEGTE
jgi:hypothetical protein